jgi:uncharacterized protein YbaA (DUF1428 family)
MRIGRRHSTLRPAALALIAAALLLTAAQGAPAPILQLVVAAGQPAPAAGNFDRFDLGGQAIAAPSNRAGDVAFFALLIRGAGQEGLFLARGGRVARIAAVGDRVPGGERIADFTERPAVALDAAGEAAFAAALTGGKATSGLFLARDGRFEAVALSGAVAPDIPGGTLTGFERPALGEHGGLAFLASVRSGRETVDAIFYRSGGRLRKLVAAGDAAPGGGVFSGLGSPAINNKDVVAFPAIVEQGPVIGGIYTVAEGQARMALAAGGAAPNGGIFAKFSEQIAIDDAGRIAFSAVVRGGPSAGVFLFDGATAVALATIGDPAPGGGTFAAFSSGPALSPGGTAAFVASIDGGPSPVAIFAAGKSGLSRIAGVGDTLPDGGRLVSFPRYPAVAIGPEDAVIFAAAIEQGGNSRDALYYYGPPRPGPR